MSAEIRADLAVLFCGHDQIVSVDLASDAKPIESHQNRAKIFNTGPRNSQLGSRDGSESDE